jgi:protein SCO1
MTSNLAHRLRILGISGLLLALSFLLTACSEDPELIGHDMESQQAPPFTLIDHRGETVQLSDLRGKAVAMTFIFTNCPDVCPLIINRMNVAFEQLPDDKKDHVAMVAITVDPERDDPETMAAYLESRGASMDHWYGLTGDLATLEPIWQAYFVTPGQRYPADPAVVEAMEAGEHDHEAFMEEGLEESSDDHHHGDEHGEEENTAYWLAHSDVIYAIDWDNKVRVLMRSADSPDDLAHNLEILVNEIPDEVSEARR